MKTIKKINLENCTIELVQKESKKTGELYEACDLVLSNGERYQVGFKVSFYTINKLSKGGKT